MGFMETVGATLATKYGTVIEGRHKGTVVALGNDPSQKSGFTDGFTQIIFLDGTEEKGRYDIKKSFKTLEISEETQKGLKVVGTFNDGETFVLDLELKLKESFLKMVLNSQKNTTPQQKREDKFRPVKVFTTSFLCALTPDTVKFLLNYYERNDVLDKVMEKSLKLLIGEE